MTEKLVYQRAQYLTSAVELKQLPSDKGAEIAFIGRSNAGKSSALNTITGIKNLARTSNTPGRTQMINLFTLTDDFRLVDLPGYGYAKVPRIVRERWAENVDKYLQTRECLRGLILVMDIRHPLKDLDKQLIEWTVGCSVPIHILLTKADKLKPSQARRVHKEVREALSFYGDSVSLQVFSSLQRTGVEEAAEKLNEWFAA